MLKTQVDREHEKHGYLLRNTEHAETNVVPVTV